MKTRFDKLLENWTKRNPLVAGELRQVTVLHDDWCRMLKSKGDCNCRPSFTYAQQPVRPGDMLSISVVSAPPAEHN